MNLPQQGKLKVYLKVVIWRQLEPSAAMVTLWWPVLLMVEIKPLEKTTELPLVTEKFFTKSCIKYNLNYGQ
jgi:hypothetical protein